MQNWNAIIESTKEVLENTCAELLEIPLHGTEHITTADGLAASNYDGTYLIRLQGISKVEDSFNSQFSVYYSVIVELCYEIKNNDAVASYNLAVNEIETIIRERLKQDSWINYSDNIAIVRFSGVSEPKTVTKGNSYLTIPIQFEFMMSSNY